MESILQNTNPLDQSLLQPFKIKQAMAGLAMEQIDESLLKYLAFFSSQFPVEATYFLHVVPRFELYRSLFEKDTPVVAGEYVVSKVLIENMSAKIRAVFSEDQIQEIKYDVREGDPLEELLKDAKAFYADLVVIGQKDAAEEHGILAKKLARNIHCNALIIPEKAACKLSKILVPVDFSPHSIKALQAAVAIKKQVKEPIEIVCLNVYEFPDFASFNITRTRTQFHHMIEADRKDAFQAFLNTYAPDEKDHIQTVLLQREMPWIPHYIKKYAVDHEVDLVVMGAKGHSKVDLLFMGSVTEKFLSINKQIPTLMIR